VTGFADFPEVTHLVGRDTIDAYAELSGDYNPLHMDPVFAGASTFKTVIAHGPIALQTVFEAIAQWLDTEDVPVGVTIDVSFRGPTRIDDRITCRAGTPVVHAGIVAVPVSCVNQDAQLVLEALIVVPRRLVPRVR
jgi:3-hydroxybutyryl-CoA dehydratase